MFHVPELSRLRRGLMASGSADGNNGAFQCPSPEPGWFLFFIASDGAEAPDVADWQWEHVSVRAVNERRSRVPSWREMCYVKALCWDEEDVVVQYHPRRSEYVNQHPDVLHLWRPKLATIPTPPPILVGLRADAKESQ